MTLFEYLAVFLSIVLSFGVIRVLDGLPAAVRPGRVYSVHVTWLIVVLWLHVQYWWVFWSYSTGVSWTYPDFLLALASPLLLYSLAITLVPRDSDSVESWREHFYRVRPRFFYLFAAWIVTVGVANWLVLGQPLLNRLRLGQGTFFLLCLGGALSKRTRFHAIFAILIVLSGFLFVTRTFLQPAPLAP